MVKTVQNAQKNAKKSKTWKELHSCKKLFCFCLVDFFSQFYFCQWLESLVTLWWIETSFAFICLINQFCKKLAHAAWALRAPFSISVQCMVPFRSLLLMWLTVLSWYVLWSHQTVGTSKTYNSANNHHHSPHYNFAHWVILLRRALQNLVCHLALHIVLNLKEKW